MPKAISFNNVESGKGTLYNPPIYIVPPKEGVVFGKFCAIAPNLKIIGINHDYNYPAIQHSFYQNYFNCDHPIDTNSNIHSKGKIVIGNDCWIGEDVVILSGVTIGDGCCIGARSVVTKSLEPYSICVGAPCKSIKRRYSQEIIDYLLELKWWNWSDEKIKINKAFFMTNLNNISIDELNKIIV